MRTDRSCPALAIEHEIVRVGAPVAGGEPRRPSEAAISTERSVGDRATIEHEPCVPRKLDADVVANPAYALREASALRQELLVFAQRECAELDAEARLAIPDRIPRDRGCSGARSIAVRSQPRPLVSREPEPMTAIFDDAN